MSKANPLFGLIGNYGDSDEESDDGSRASVAVSEAAAGRNVGALTSINHSAASATIHPAPIPHCPWSACYDESSGFTYYWNHQTNAVTWETPSEYLLALKLAKQQLHLTGSTEVSAEEWQLYQQALAEKQNLQNKVTPKTTVAKTGKKNTPASKGQGHQLSKKRSHSDDEDVKIELITSYHNSDSDSNDEVETPVKNLKPATPIVSQKAPTKTNTHKKIKANPQVEYGPTLPSNCNYTHPIGPELPPELVGIQPSCAENKVENDVPVKESKDENSSKHNESEDIEDETTLFRKLKDKAKLLEKLGGEIPKELQKMIESDTGSGNATPKQDETKSLSDNIDDLLEEIEKKELPKVTKAKKIDMFDKDSKVQNIESPKLSPKHNGDGTPPLETKPLFPSIKNMEEIKDLSPKSIDMDDDTKSEVKEKKGVNVYLTDSNETLEKVNKKKLRISNSLLPERKKNEEPAYTTKYSQFIEGFSNERTGLGFSKENSISESPKNTISYGKGLIFTKGEVLNEDKKDEDLDDTVELVEAKLKYLTQLQPCHVTPVQEMLIQMQTLRAGAAAGGVSRGYWRGWAARAAQDLRAHERSAAPPGWTASFQRYARSLTQFHVPPPAPRTPAAPGHAPTRSDSLASGSLMSIENIHLFGTPPSRTKCVA